MDLGDEKLTSALEESKKGMEREEGPIVCVEVKDNKKGTTSTWSLSKFKWVVCGVRMCGV